MANGRHRRSKSASSCEGISPSQKSKATGRISPDNASYGNGSSSPQKFMVERGQSSSMRATESMAKCLAEKVFKEAEPKSPSSSGVARLIRLEGLNSLWSNKQKAKLQDGHHQNNASINIEPDRQPNGCLINRRMPIKKLQFSEVCDDPEASHFVNHRRSCEWSASSMPTESEMGLTRQKIDTKHLSFGELIDVKPEVDDPLDLQYSKDKLMNYARKLDSRQASSSRSPPERMDGLLLEAHNCYGAYTSHEISSTQAEEKKKKKDMLPRPIIFPRSGMRDIPIVVESGSSLYHSHGNIPNFRKTKEYPGAETSKEITWRTNDVYHDGKFSKPISKLNRIQAREIIRQLKDARFESENEMYPGSREFMVGGSSYDAHRSDFNRELDMHKLSSRNHSVEDNKWGRHPSRGHVNKDENKRLLEALKVTRTYRDLELADDPTMLREVIAIPHGEARSNNFAYRGSGRSSARLGTDSRSSILGGPWSEIEKASSRSRSLPPTEGGIHRRDTCLLSEEKHVMHSDPISHGRSRAVKGYPFRDNFLPSQASTSRSKMPLPFPPIRIKGRGSSIQATFEVLMEPNVEGVSETERDDNSGDTVYDKMVDKQEIVTLPSELCVPRHSSEDNESSAGDDDQEDFSVQGLCAGPPEEGSPSLNQLEAEPLVSESFYSSDYASPLSVFDVEDASSNFERFNDELNELRTKLQLPKLDSGACDEISSPEEVAYPSSSAERWEDCYTFDVLIQSSFQEFGFDMLPLMWHDPNHPLDPTLFDTLEKKYGDDFPELRSERLLLFDRINSALLEIFQKRVDLAPFFMPKLGLLSTRVKNPTQDAVESLISQKSTNSQVVERILLREMQWTDPVEEFASIGEEIEELVLDDIIAEFLRDPSGLMDIFCMIPR